MTRGGRDGEGIAEEELGAEWAEVVGKGRKSRTTVIA